MFIAIVIILVLLLLVVVARFIQKAADIKEHPGSYAAENDKKLLLQQRISLHYQAGHPAIDEPVKVYLSLNNNTIEIGKMALFTKDTDEASVIATIPVSAISEVLVNDRSITAYETTFGRMIRFGELGLALKTKERTEVADLIIVWRDGHQNRETCFTKKGTGAVADLNIVRDQLVVR